MTNVAIAPTRAAADDLKDTTGLNHRSGMVHYAAEMLSGTPSDAQSSAAAPVM